MDSGLRDKALATPKAAVVANVYRKTPADANLIAPRARTRAASVHSRV